MRTGNSSRNKLDSINDKNVPKRQWEQKRLAIHNQENQDDDEAKKKKVEES